MFLVSDDEALYAIQTETLILEDFEFDGSIILTRRPGKFLPKKAAIWKLNGPY